MTTACRLQAVAVVMADLPAQFDTFKQQLLRDLEHQLLGNWGEQLKAAAAQETSQQVDAGLKVRAMLHLLALAVLQASNRSASRPNRDAGIW